MRNIKWKETLTLWTFGLLKVPLIFWVRPKVLVLDDTRAEILIPLKRCHKNHLNSMYFGVLCVGADVAGGIHLVKYMNGKLGKLSFVFKDFHAEFLKRPEADVHFSCVDGQAIADTVLKASQSGERENVAVQVIATTPTLSQSEPVARFTLTLSVKYKSGV